MPPTQLAGESRYAMSVVQRDERQVAGSIRSVTVVSAGGDVPGVAARPKPQVSGLGGTVSRTKAPRTSSCCCTAIEKMAGAIPPSDIENARARMGDIKAPLEARDTGRRTRSEQMRRHVDGARGHEIAI